MAAIIFDFDGTIADSFDYVSEFLAEQAGVELDAERKQSLRGLSVASMVRAMGFKWWQGIMLFYRGRARMKHAIKHLRAFAGMPELIRKLHAEGHELFIVSANSNANVRHFLHAQKIHKYFLQIYGGTGLFSKSSTLRGLLKEQNFKVEEAVYVGDESRDVQAAQAIGMRSVAVTWGFAHRDNLVALKPTALADTPKELMKILEEI